MYDQNPLIEMDMDKATEGTFSSVALMNESKNYIN